MKSYLPVGSVISIKNRKGKFVIVGLNVMHDNKNYDYMCIAYPYGVLLGLNLELYFNDDDVDILYFVGNTNYKA